MIIDFNFNIKGNKYFQCKLNKKIFDEDNMLKC